MNGCGTIKIWKSGMKRRSWLRTCQDDNLATKPPSRDVGLVARLSS